MKVLSILALICAGCLLTAQELWDGKVESLSIGTYKTTGTNVQVADGISERRSVFNFVIIDKRTHY